MNEGDHLSHIPGVWGPRNTPGKRGIQHPPLLLISDIPLLLLLCGNATQAVVSVPIIVPPSLLSLRYGTSVVSSVRRDGNPLGIDISGGGGGGGGGGAKDYASAFTPKMMAMSVANSL